MTNTEYRLFICTILSMMTAMVMLLATMHGIVSADTVRTPFQVVGLTALTAFAALHIAYWRRRGKV